MKTKRLLAIILAFAMVMGVMPSFSVMVSAANDDDYELQSSAPDAYSDGVSVDETGRKVEKYRLVYANGQHLVIEAGTIAGTAIYYMDGRTKKYINKNGAAGDDFSGCYIYGGIEYDNNVWATKYTKDLSITMNGGNVDHIIGNAGGNSYANGGRYEYLGVNHITINGGTVNKISGSDIYSWTEKIIVEVNGGNVDAIFLGCYYSTEDYFIVDAEFIIRGGNVKRISDFSLASPLSLNYNFLSLICMTSNIDISRRHAVWTELRNVGGKWIVKGHRNLTIPEGDVIIVKEGETFLPNQSDVWSYFKNNYTLTNNGAIICYGTPGVYANKVTGNPVVVIKDGNTIEITSGTQLAYCTKLMSEGILPADINFVLMNNIGMSGIEYIPLGWRSSYKGTFDGNGKTISGLGNAVANGTGLVSYIGSEGVVKNLTIYNATIYPEYTDSKYNDDAAGAIAHRNFGTISNCVVKNSYLYLGEYKYLGGIAGMNYKNAVIENCAVINNSYQRKGAAYGGYYDIVGIKYPYLIGGLVNYNTGTVKNCYVYDCKIDSGENSTAYDGYIMPSYYENIDATNCYVYGGSGALVVGADKKTQEEFADGSVAWLLNEEGAIDAWGQNIDNGEANAGYPTPGVAVVYKVENCNKDAVYSNTNENKGHIFADGKCSVCGMNTPAADDNNDGIYEIANLNNLIWLAQAVNAGENDIDAILVADIEAEYEDIIPIGTLEHPYTGTFDGQGYKIKNALIPTFSRDYSGIFGVAGDGAVIKNFTVVNKDRAISGDNYVAGILGASVGEGVVTIENCGNEAAIIADKYAGGIFGGSVDGKAVIKITNCYNTAYVSATYGESGGIAGYMGEQSESIVENSYSTGSVNGGSGQSVSFAGGVAQFDNCYALIAQDNVATVSANEVKNGALANKLGEAFGQNLEDTNATHPVLGGKPVYYYRQGVCTDDEAGYEFVYTNHKANGEYSYIHNEEIGEEGYDGNGFCLKCGGYQRAEVNANDEYEIDNAGKLYWFANYVNSGKWQRSAVQTKDIVINENLMKKITVSDEDYSAVVKDGETVREWIPMGSFEANGFGGSYNGNGYKISGLYINDSDEKYAGFVSKAASGSVKGLTIENSYIRGKSAGGVVGYASKHTYTGTMFGNKVLNSFVVADNYAGGIAAYLDAASATRNIVYDTVVYSPLSAGAVAGYVSSQGSVSLDYVTENVCDKMIGYNAGGKVDVAEAKPKKAFSSGEVTYLLNADLDEGTLLFYQIIGKEPLPVFYGVEGECEGGIVYAGYAGCGATEISYANTELFAEIPEHTYDNTCDKQCNLCPHTREITHTYDNDCDSYCNICNTYRSDITHTYENSCDNYCDICDDYRVTEHTYSDECDAFCDVCDDERAVNHLYDDDCDADCNRGCGYVRVPEHNYDYYAEYEYDENRHWQRCDDCGEPRYGEHDLYFADNEDGTHSESCSMCDYAAEGKVHEKAYADNGDNTHSLVCVGCGYKDEESTEAHSLDKDGFCQVCNGYEMGDRNDNDTPDDEWDDYYEIRSIGQLYWMASQINSGRDTYMQVHLMNDIDVNPGYRFNKDGAFAGGYSPRVWIPAGNGAWTYFTGSFYGNGHTISGLYVNDEEANYVGLFGHIAYNPQLKDVNISNSYFSGNKYVGAVVGYGEVYASHIIADGSVIVSGNEHVGGLIGYLSSNSEMANNYSRAYVHDVSSNTYTGGLVGSSHGNVRNCYTTSNLLVGYQNEGSYGGVITNCYYLSEGELENDPYGGTTKKSFDEFESGEVAYLLQAGVLEEGDWDENDEWVSYIPEVWGQTIGVDEFPVLGGRKVLFDGESYYNEKVNVTVTVDGTEKETDGSIVLGTENGDGTYSLPENVVGYYIDEDFVDAGKYAVVGGEVINTVDFNVTMVNGAQVRFGGGLDENGKISTGNGLRFLATVDRSAFDADGYGMKITAEGSDNETIVNAEKWQNDGVTFTVAITDMAESNYIRKFTATPFVKVKYTDGSEKTIYGTQTVTRSIYQVAAGLLKDETQTAYGLSDVLNAYANQTGIRLVVKDGELKANTSYTAKGAYELTEDELHFAVSDAAYDEAGNKYSVILTAQGNAEIITDNDFWYEYIRINNNNSLVRDKVTVERVEGNEKAVKVTFAADGLIERPSDANDNKTPDDNNDDFDSETEGIN